MSIIGINDNGIRYDVICRTIDMLLMMMMMLIMIVMMMMMMLIMIVMMMVIVNITTDVLSMLQ